ncbi:hypothetical protein, partial [Paractinoplanes ferrugineus]|uniref:hypothetical protein n=1 Tax=Paractinoplanes ferrugineus TaxID=113564 RepID=UPI0019457B25
EQAAQLCVARDKTGAGCASAIAAATYFDNCPNCKREDCEGHGYWCTQHLEAARAGRFRWHHNDSIVQISRRSEPTNMTIEEPVF